MSWTEEDPEYGYIDNDEFIEDWDDEFIEDWDDEFEEEEEDYDLPPYSYDDFDTEGGRA